jgi:hypothetical protein
MKPGAPVLCASLRQRLLVLGLLAVTTGHAYGMSFKLEDFIKADDMKIIMEIPQLLTSFPGARFLTTGFSSPSGQWTFIRVESEQACSDQFCATIISHDKTNWKIMLEATKDIIVSPGTDGAESTRVELMSKDGQVIVRYMSGVRVIYIAR